MAPGRSVESSIRAVPPPEVWPTAMFVMLTPASPRAEPTLPIMPGRSSLRTIEQVRREGKLDDVVVDHDDPLRARRAQGARDAVAAAAERHLAQVVRPRPSWTTRAPRDPGPWQNGARSHTRRAPRCAAAKTPFSDAEREDAGVLARELPLVLDLEMARHPVAQGRQQTAQALGHPVEQAARPRRTR